jgi:hypothetical protein
MVVALPRSREVQTIEAFGDAGGLVLAFDLHRIALLHLQDAWCDLRGLEQREATADARAHRDRRREAQPVEAVVHGLPDSGRHRLLGAGQSAQQDLQRQRQIAVGDRPAERRFAPRTIGVDMDPLMVARGIGEGDDTVLGHRHPVADMHLLPDACLQRCKRLRRAAHFMPIRLRTSSPASL